VRAARGEAAVRLAETVEESAFLEADANHKPGSGQDGEHDQRRPVPERQPDAHQGQDQTGVRGVSNPAVGAALDDGLAGVHADVHGEEVSEQRHRPLPDRDPCAHEDHPDDEERPAPVGDPRRLHPVGQVESSEEPAVDRGDHHEQAAPVLPRPLPVEAASHANAHLQENPDDDDRVEGDLRGQLRIGQRRHARQR
jgi:hypothetical protein